MIIIPLSLSLEGLGADFAGAVAFISCAVMAEVSSSALEEEDSSGSFNNLLLLTLLSFRSLSSL